MLPRPPVRGFLRLLILDFLKEEPLHGYEIMRRMCNMLNYTPSPGIIYPTLQFLEESGLICSELEGRRRKVYRITEEGLKYLRSHENELAFFLKEHRKLSRAREMIPASLFPLVERLLSLSDELTQDEREAVRNAFLKLEGELRRILGDRDGSHSS
ncbi:MAG: PadR family transcriptional regulator [Candidatus Korarchaeum sp.]|nr:PadR family transcriptional regulator [Candidatus Korarchaeum sp.]